MIVASATAIPLIVAIVVMPVAVVAVVTTTPVVTATIILPGKRRLPNLALPDGLLLLLPPAIKLSLLLTLAFMKRLLLLPLAGILLRLMLFALALLPVLLLALAILLCGFLALTLAKRLLLPFLLMTMQPLLGLLLFVLTLLHVLLLTFAKRLLLPLGSLSLLNRLLPTRLLSLVARVGPLPFLSLRRFLPVSAIARGPAIVLFVPWRGCNRRRQPAAKGQHDGQPHPSRSAPHHRVPPSSDVPRPRPASHSKPERRVNHLLICEAGIRQRLG
ncbi:hypothetical protein [Parvibaculum sp.]|jgi:hypothetical protein|uniref:hypothetical protein n=1 Tax=Parvibaculum sp. TaxID=2024848 RepID=UPI002FDAA7B3